MKESTKKKWVPMTVVFLSVFGSFAALMYLSITTFSTAQNQSSSPFFRFQQNKPAFVGPPTANGVVVEPNSVAAGWAKMVLLRDREVRVGGAVLTYRGLGARSTFRIDAVIPDLDPQYTYRQQFDIASARKGFRLGGEHLVLLSAGRYKIRLEHYTPAR